MMAITKAPLNPADLRKFPFLASLSIAQLVKIAEVASRTLVKAGNVVLHQGDVSSKMYLMLKGRVKIEREDMEGKTIQVGDLAQYQTFGEVALLSAEPCQTSITTTEDSEFLVIGRELVVDIIRESDPEGIIEVFSAVSEQIRRADDRLFQAVLTHRTFAAQMEVEKQRALTQMVAGVAHEINTPLGVINTAVNIMARELASTKEVTAQRAADIAESLELIRRNAESAHRLVQNFKKVSVSQLTNEKEVLDISKVIDETIELVMVNLKHKGVSINFSNRLLAGQEKWVGFQGILSQIVINLLNNVERHAYPNGVGGAVDITIELKDKEHYLLTVQDFGMGIPRENQSRIFEAFFTTNLSNGGTGLGLAIVQDLVLNVLKGEIRLNSVEAEGAKFVVVFPREIPE